MIVGYVFKLTIDVNPENNTDEYGRELAEFFEESLFNGEDVVGVEYVKKEEIRRV